MQINAQNGLPSSLTPSWSFG